ncbi:MAG: hypothetical protein HY986_25140 [Candidatus Melainabacteria bacterium]|nr:hypothetical protein [Candidatus Melainabacteria bacterium]
MIEETFPTGKLALNYLLIEVKGEDAERFLQSQTTSDVKALQIGDGQESSLLDRKAKVIAYFNLYKTSPTAFLILAPEVQKQAIIEHLERFIFADKVEVVPLVFPFCELVSGSQAPLKIPPSAGSRAALMPLSKGFIARIHISPCPTFIIFSEEETLTLPQLSREELLIRRVEAGQAEFLTDYSDSLIVELSLSSPAVSYTKGCFQGQEVLARVKAQGSPSRQLVGLVLNSSEAINFPVGSQFHLNAEETAGTLVSHGFSPRLSKHIALAFLKRDLRVPGREIEGYVEVEGKRLPLKAQVQVLPFIEPERDEDLAKRLYEEALQDFTAGNGAAAIQTLKQVVLLAPTFEDGYEALGVMLSKVDEGKHIDEAIACMKELAALNPDSIMAHANLSVFYLEKGDKEMAEEEKAISMSIRMRQAAREAMQEKNARDEQEKERKEAAERIKLFQEVLQIDADDLFANQGLGNCYNILGEHERAIGYLEKAIAIKENHTQCYEEMGKAYEALGNLTRAAEYYGKGVEIAAKKGDMQPLKAMKAKMEALLLQSGK